MKRGQVWIETVIYTLIGIAIIGIVLGLAKPKIDQKKDEIAIEQAIDSMNNIDKKIFAIQTIPGNKRVINLKIGRGSLIVDPVQDALIWEITSSYEYSEKGKKIEVGGLEVKTIPEGSAWKVQIIANYSYLNITAEKDDKIKKVFSQAPSPYKFFVENSGKINRKTIINIGGS